MSFGPRLSFEWHLRTRSLVLGRRTVIMGVVNVTPDSFSDGGRYLSVDRAVEHGLFLLESGADILDIGGESSRPGSPAGTGEAISAEEEQTRVLPVLERLRRVRPGVVLSIDTYHASTARLGAKAGAEIVNDVSGLLWDPAMAEICAELGCGIVVTHTRGLPSAWAAAEALAPREVLPLVLGGLQGRVAAALTAGIARASVVLDPGFGFGKRGEENWALLAGFERLQTMGFPLLAGVSRKGFLPFAAEAGKGGTIPPSSARDLATHTAHTAAILAGAHIVRVHDARGARKAADVADAILNAAEVVPDAGT